MGSAQTYNGYGLVGESVVGRDAILGSGEKIGEEEEVVGSSRVFDTL